MLAAIVHYSRPKLKEPMRRSQREKLIAEDVAYVEQYGIGRFATECGMSLRGLARLVGVSAGTANDWNRKGFRSGSSKLALERILDKMLHIDSV